MKQEVLSYFPTSAAARTDEPLLWLGGGGHETRVSKAYYHDGTRRGGLPHVVLQVTLAGQGFYHRNGGNRELLSPGRAFLDELPGPFEYGYAGDEGPNPTGVYELVFLTLHGPVAVDWMNRIHRQFGPVLDFGPEAAIGESLLAFHTASAAGAFKDRYQFSAQLYSLLMQIFSVLTTSRIQRTPLVSRAIELIDLRFSDPRLSVLTLARRLDCSREHLTREFRRALGVSPLAYITQQRVRAAARHLRSDPDKLDVVARHAGFSSAGYLCKVFRQSVGVTPAEFRARPWIVAP